MVKNSTESLIKEYETTQDMIKHYETLNLQFGILTQTSVFILIGLALGFLGEDLNKFFTLFPIVIIIVAILHSWCLLWFIRHRAITKLKINRILELERKLHWQQFRKVDNFFKSNKNRTIPIRFVLYFYHILIPLVLALYYLYLYYVV